MAKIITIEWEGKEYTLNESEAFLAADAIEGILTIGELIQMRADGDKIRFVKLAQCYSALLSEVGLSVPATKIRQGFLDSIKNKPAEQKLAAAVAAMDMLMEIIMDGAPSDDGGAKEPGNDSALAS